MGVFKSFLKKIGWGEIQFKLQSIFSPNSISPGELRHRLANRIHHLELMKEKKPGVKVDKQLMELHARIKILQDNHPEVDLRSLRDELKDEKKEWEERDLRGESGSYAKFAAEQRKSRGERM